MICNRKRVVILPELTMTARVLRLLTWMFPPIAPSVMYTGAFAGLSCVFGIFVVKAIDAVTLGIFSFVGATAGMLHDWHQARREHSSEANKTSWGSVAEPERLVFRWFGLAGAWLFFSIVPALVGTWAYQFGRDENRTVAEREQREMIQHINNAKAHSSGREYLDAVREYTEAIRICEKTPTDKHEKTKKALASLYQARGLDHEKAKNRVQAIADLDRSIGLDGDSATAYYWRGLLHYSNQDFNMAMKDCEKSTALDHSRSHAHLLRADIHLSKLEWDQAIAAYSEAIKLDNKLAEAYERRSAAHRAKGNQSVAAADLEEAGRIKASLVKKP